MMGLDVSSSSAKLVELDQDKAGNLVLLHCAIEQLENGWIVDGNIEKFDEVAEALKRLVKKSGAKTKNVAMALPPSAVITKKIVLPGGMSEQELEQQVENEANQYIPFPLDEVSLDFCVVGTSANSEEDIEIMIAAARKEKVQDIQGLAEAVGLNPVVVDVESYASRLAAGRLIQNFPNKGEGQIVALFEIGALTTSMQVLRNDEVLYDRDQSFGGAQLTQQIVRQYGFSQEEAETKKRNGDLPEDYESVVLTPFIETIVHELGRALQFFFTSTQFNQVNHIVLAGGCAVLPGVDEVVASRTQINTVVANPFADMVLSDRVRAKSLLADASSLMVACGLALRRFDE